MNINGVNGQFSGAYMMEKTEVDGLERAFLSEMLKYSGSRQTMDPLGGADSESQFSSMLNDAYADAIAARIDLRLVSPERIK